MPGQVVDVSAEDSIRITAGGRSLQIPASVVLAADRVLRRMLDDTAALTLDPVEDDDTGWEGYEATFDSDWRGQIFVGHGGTPWAALVDLARHLAEVANGPAQA